MTRPGTSLIAALALSCACACGLADDVVGVLRVGSDTNGEATVEMPFMPFGDGTIPTFLSGTFFGDGGVDSDRLWRISLEDGALTNAVFASGEWIDPADGQPSSLTAARGDTLVLASGDAMPFDFWLHGRVAPRTGWPFVSGLSVDQEGAFADFAVATGGYPADIFAGDADADGTVWSYLGRRPGYPHSFAWRDASLGGMSEGAARLYLVSDASRDTDGDGVSDSLERYVYGTSPILCDTDGDGIVDGLEIAWGSNPLVPDQPVPFAFFEPFEPPSVRHGPIDGQNGWGANSTNGAVVQGECVHAGTGALRMSADDAEGAAPVVTRAVDCDAEVVWADMYQTIVRGGCEPLSASDVFAACAFDMDGHPVMTDGNALTTNLHVSVSSHPRWIRCTCRFDFRSRSWDLYLDGVMVADGLAMRGSIAAFHELVMRGNGHLDDLRISTDRPLGLSSDGDFLPDEWEIRHFGTLDRNGSGDADGDGMSDLAECRAGTDPLVPSWDTDGDGLPDWWEVANGLDPLSPGRKGTVVFAETFERPPVLPGELSGQNGWTANRLGEALVQEDVVCSGAGALRMDGGEPAVGEDVVSVSRPVAFGDDMLWSDVRVRSVLDGAGGHLVDVDVFAACAFDSAGHPVMIDGDAVVTNLQVRVADDRVWARCTCRFDFVARRWDFYLDGVIAGRNLAMRGNARSLSEIALARGAGFLDDWKLTTERPEGLSSDGDAMPDEWEFLHFGTLDRNGADDADADGLPDADEFRIGADPLASDTDGDGMPDGWEVVNGFDPLDPADATADPDGDGVPNADEYAFGGDPHLSEPDPRIRWPGLRAEFWRTTGKQATMPDFAALFPSTLGTVPCVDMPTVPWRDGAAIGNYFACRFDGFIRIPTDGRYTFHLTSNAGAAMSLDGETVVSDPSAHSPRARSASRDLVRGFHPVSIDFYKNTGSESLVLEWEGPGLDREIVPAEAFCNMPVAETLPTGYALGLVSDGVETLGALHAPLSGTYRLVASSTRGFRLWLDGRLLADCLSTWRSVSRTVSLPLAAGLHDIRVEHASFDAGFALSWSCDGTPSEAVPGRFLFHAVSPEAADGDGDGMPDWWEELHGFDPADPSDAALDPDGDGLSNLAEFQAGTDPRRPDTDGDGMPDAWEAAHGTCPFLHDALSDPDGDGLANIEEHAVGTDVLNADTDGDGVTDGDERHVFLSDPMASDFDGSFETNAVLAAADADTAWGSWVVKDGAVVLAGRCGTVFYTNDLVLAEAGLRQIRLTAAFAGSYDAELVCRVDGERVGVSRLSASSVPMTNDVAFLTHWLQPGTHVLTFELQNFANGVQFSFGDVAIGLPGGPDGDGNGVPDWIDERMRGSCTERGLAVSSKVSPFCLRGRASSLPQVAAASGNLSVRPLPFLGWWADVPLDATAGVDVEVAYEGGMKVESVHVDWIPFEFMSETNVVLRRGDSLLLAPGDGQAVSLDGVSLVPSNTVASIPCRFDAVGEHFLEGTDGDATNVVRVVVVECAFRESVPVWRGKVNTLRPDGTNFAEMAVSWDTGSKLVSASVSGGSCACQLSVSAYGRPRALSFEIPNADASVAGGMALEPFAAYYTLDKRYYVAGLLDDGTRVVENRLSAFDVPPSLTLRMTGNSGICFEDGAGGMTLTADSFDETGDCIYRFLLPAGVDHPCQFLRAYFDGKEIAQ